jgi:hypothetical protein
LLPLLLMLLVRVVLVLVRLLPGAQLAIAPPLLLGLV